MNKGERRDLVRLLDKSDIGIAAGFTRPAIGNVCQGKVKFCIGENNDYMHMPFVITSIIEAYADIMQVPPEKILGLLGGLIKDGTTKIEDEGVKNFD